MHSLYALLLVAAVCSATYCGRGFRCPVVNQFPCGVPTSCCDSDSQVCQAGVCVDKTVCPSTTPSPTPSPSPTFTDCFTDIVVCGNNTDYNNCYSCCLAGVQICTACCQKDQSCLETYCLDLEGCFSFCYAQSASPSVSVSTSPSQTVSPSTSPSSSISESPSSSTTTSPTPTISPSISASTSCPPVGDFPSCSASPSGACMTCCRDSADTCVGSCPSGCTDCRTACDVSGFACFIECNGFSQSPSASPINSIPPTIAAVREPGTQIRNRGFLSWFMDCIRLW